MRYRTPVVVRRRSTQSWNVRLVNGEAPCSPLQSQIQMSRSAREVLQTVSATRVPSEQQWIHIRSSRCSRRLLPPVRSTQTRCWSRDALRPHKSVSHRTTSRNRTTHSSPRFEPARRALEPFEIEATTCSVCRGVHEVSARRAVSNTAAANDVLARPYLGGWRRCRRPWDPPFHPGRRNSSRRQHGDFKARPPGSSSKDNCSPGFSAAIGSFSGTPPSADTRNKPLTSANTMPDSPQVATTPNPVVASLIGRPRWDRYLVDAVCPGVTEPLARLEKGRGARCRRAAGTPPRLSRDRTITPFGDLYANRVPSADIPEIQPSGWRERVGGRCCDRQAQHRGRPDSDGKRAIPAHGRGDCGYAPCTQRYVAKSRAMPAVVQHPSRDRAGPPMRR